MQNCKNYSNLVRRQESKQAKKACIHEKESKKAISANICYLEVEKHVKSLEHSLLQRKQDTQNANNKNACN